VFREFRILVNLRNYKNKNLQKTFRISRVSGVFRETKVQENYLQRLTKIGARTKYPDVLTENRE